MSLSDDSNVCEANSSSTLGYYKREISLGKTTLVRTQALLIKYRQKISMVWLSFENNILCISRLHERRKQIGAVGALYLLIPVSFPRWAG